MITFTNIMMIPFVMAHSHHSGGHSGHSGHSEHSSHNGYSGYGDYSMHKPYNSHYVATSVISTYAIFGHFSNGVENLFYLNENYHTYSIKYYIKLIDDDEECIYYVISKNFNNESTIDASNMKILENITFIEYENNMYKYCRNLDNFPDFTILIVVILVLFILSFIVNCLCGSKNYTNRELY
tara:strand:+ start:115 stop:660 length:546 start_codon:yes stop_codon:yes gene_type:complete